MCKEVRSQDPPLPHKGIVASVNQPYDPEVFVEHRHTHWVGARVYLEFEGPARQFDGLIVEAFEEYADVEAIVANVGMQTFRIPATCVVYMYVGRKK